MRFCCLLSFLTLVMVTAGCGGRDATSACDGGCESSRLDAGLGSDVSQVDSPKYGSSRLDATDEASVESGTSEVSLSDVRPADVFASEAGVWLIDLGTSEAGAGEVAQVDVGRIDGGVDLQVDSTAGDAGCGTSAVPAGQSPDDVTFLAGVARGALHGPTWSNSGRDEVLTSPVCSVRGIDAGAAGGHSCAGQYEWDSTTSLCMSGSVPTLSSEVLVTGVSWGVAVGVDADGCGGTIGKKYSSVSATVVGVPKSVLDAGLYYLGLEVLDRKTGARVLYYASDGGTGRRVELTSFTTHWWDAAGDHLSAEGAVDISSFVVYVMASSTVSTKLDGVCLVGVSWR